ncbi:unnamed protein product, partial [Effrenium voratum]
MGRGGPFAPAGFDLQRMEFEIAGLQVAFDSFCLNVLYYLLHVPILTYAVWALLAQKTYTEVISNSPFLMARVDVLDISPYASRVTTPDPDPATRERCGLPGGPFSCKNSTPAVYQECVSLLNEEIVQTLDLLMYRSCSWFCDLSSGSFQPWCFVPTTRIQQLGSTSLELTTFSAFNWGALSGRDRSMWVLLHHLLRYSPVHFTYKFRMSQPAPFGHDPKIAEPKTNQDAHTATVDQDGRVQRSFIPGAPIVIPPPSLLQLAGREWNLQTLQIGGEFVSMVNCYTDGSDLPALQWGAHAPVEPQLELPLCLLSVQQLKSSSMRSFSDVLNDVTYSNTMIRIDTKQGNSFHRLFSWFALVMSLISFVVLLKIPSMLVTTFAQRCLGPLSGVVKRVVEESFHIRTRAASGGLRLASDALAIESLAPEGLAEPELAKEMARILEQVGDAADLGEDLGKHVFRTLGAREKGKAQDGPVHSGRFGHLLSWGVAVDVFDITAFFSRARRRRLLEWYILPADHRATLRVPREGVGPAELEEVKELSGDLSGDGARVVGGEDAEGAATQDLPLLRERLEVLERNKARREEQLQKRCQAQAELSELQSRYQDLKHRWKAQRKVEKALVPARENLAALSARVEVAELERARLGLQLQELLARPAFQNLVPEELELELEVASPAHRVPESKECRLLAGVKGLEITSRYDELRFELRRWYWLGCPADLTLSPSCTMALRVVVLAATAAIAIAGKEGYSDGCASCFGDVFGCTRQHCKLKCIGGQTPACKQCVKDAGCVASFTGCSGFTPPSLVSATCTGSADPTPNFGSNKTLSGQARACYQGSARVLALKEDVHVKVDSFSANQGTMDFVGSGPKAISCLGKAFQKNGQSITTDLSDCCPDLLKLSGIKYCSDQDMVIVDAEVASLHEEIQLTKVTCDATIVVRVLSRPVSPASYGLISERQFGRTRCKENALRHGRSLRLQVGINMRVMVYNPNPRTRDEETVFVNPRIISASDDRDYAAEGCLSFPRIRGSVQRPTWVEVE